MYLKRGASERPLFTRAVLESSAAGRSSRAIPVPARNSTARPPSSAPAASGAPSPTSSSSPGTPWPAPAKPTRSSASPVTCRATNSPSRSTSIWPRSACPWCPPSPVPVFPANPVVGLNITNIGGAVSLKLPLSAQPVQYILVFGARPQSPGVSYVDHYTILGLLTDPEGGLSDITELYLAKFHLLPVGQRIFIRTVQQINGWRDLPQTNSARIPAQ